MKLSDLDPRWFDFDGQRAGFTFLCPHCRTTRIGCKSIPLPMRDQCEIFAAAFPENAGEIVPMKQDYSWSIVGADWDSISVSPSIDASASGHWHGTIKNGEVA